MAKKRKPPAKRKSGAQGRKGLWWKRLNDNPASAFHGILRSRKRGQPKGRETDRRKLIRQDVLWLEMGGVLNDDWTDSMVADELLLDDAIRWEKYKLFECQYRMYRMWPETLRRYIAAARNK